MLSYAQILSIIAIIVVLIAATVATIYYLTKRSAAKSMMSENQRFDEERRRHEAAEQSLREDFNRQLELLRQQSAEHAKMLNDHMRSVSESVLKERQRELDENNTKQVGTLIDPLRKSLNDLEKALNSNRESQRDAMTRLDQAIRMNMEKSASLGETADRLSRALTGDVKVQGNFGELKLRQLFEDLGLNEGEQYDAQQALRDHYGKPRKSGDERTLIPDFVLHFPNNRHVVVDSKMSLTAFELYMNAEDENQRARHLADHIASVRAQFKLLASKDYSQYLPDGYNRLDFDIMYIPIEGALQLALMNDRTLWREAYDMGVLILGPQSMYMNLRILEMTWRQVRQLENQQEMVRAANLVIERVQDLAKRLNDVESSVQSTVTKINSLKTTMADHGHSVITAAKSLIKAGAKENPKKPSLAAITIDSAASTSIDTASSKDTTSVYLDSDSSSVIPNPSELPEA